MMVKRELVKIILKVRVPEIMGEPFEMKPNSAVDLYPLWKKQPEF